jgi:hypothetical protein
LQSLFGRKSAGPAKPRARTQWHAPESRPLQLGGDNNPFRRGSKPDAMTAGLGLIALLGVGLLAAFVVDQTASSQAEAGPQAMAEPAPQPVEAPVAAQAREPEPQSAEKAPAPVEATAVAPATEPRPEPATALQPVQQPQVAALPVAASEPEIAVIPSDDPRWAVVAANNAMAIAALNSTTVNSETMPTPADVVTAAFAEAEPQIGVANVPIPTPKPVDDPIVTAAVARKAKAVQVPLPSDPISGIVQRQAQAQTTRQARIRTAVKMRSGPADEASVITVVPGNATVSLVGCKSWCEIVFNDRRGFVYKGFIIR